MIEVGYMYNHGQGTEQNDEKAHEYYQKAADLGNPYGIANLAWQIITDDYPDTDYAKAVEYFTQAAESGVANAVFGLGECYYAGKGVEKDPEKAAEYYRQALEAGYELEEPTEEEHVKEVLGEEAVTAP